MDEKARAVVFPGQGTQRGGMGKDFYDKVEISRKTYEEASQAKAPKIYPGYTPQNQ